jgi:hypothetical protein
MRCRFYYHYLRDIIFPGNYIYNVQQPVCQVLHGPSNRRCRAADAKRSADEVRRLIGGD